jgi:hypothetical protein
VLATEEVNQMSGYDSLVGQTFTRNGIRFTIVKCEGATVMAAVARGGQIERVPVPLAEVLDALAVNEITVTELPSPAPQRRSSSST